MFTRTMVQDMHEEVFSKSRKIQPEKHAAEWTEFQYGVVPILSVGFL